MSVIDTFVTKFTRVNTATLSGEPLITERYVALHGVSIRAILRLGLKTSNNFDCTLQSPHTRHLITKNRDNHEAIGA